MTSHTRNETIRNVAIIAHVDHGKTTLVDAMFRRAGVFREGQILEERLMDRMDLERERGITIAAKNCAVTWKGIKINIIDTPGHADFGGEVERALSMVDGAILLVDSAEGPLPQTRFVLNKTLEAGMPVIVVINKIDRGDARPQAVLSEISDLFIDLDATEEQYDFPLLYAIARDGIAQLDLEEEGTTLDPLLDAIVTEIPGPVIREDKPFQMLVSDLGYSDYLGRLAIGRIYNQGLKASEALVRLDDKGQSTPLRVSKLQVYQGISMADADHIQPGDVVILAGIEDVHIGDTICTAAAPRAMRRITVDEPTVAMLFMRNSGPLAGKEGRFVQSTRIGERLKKETLRNVSLVVEPSEGGEGFLVKGRGEFQMAILIEQMRREGFELCVGRPQVIMRTRDGVKEEPVERLFIDCADEYVGIVTEKISLRKGRMVNLVNHSRGRTRLEFSIPSRGLIGFRDELLTDTRGTGIMNAYLEGYEPYRGDFPSRATGSLISDRAGSAVPYALFNLEPRGQMFLGAGDPVYEGMVVGEHNRDNDLDVNPCKTKKLSNVRAAGRDDNVVLTPHRVMTLEMALNFIRDDEIVEVTPSSLRIRKMVLAATERKRAR
ncbi:translational GTPase TypA [Alkalispirochaeta alkalica]|uniref:translational GTPase TypA n=1 Tax=Alkalispirochaeta alkalica TaxID=46356 RepID=UPI0003751873|nr:translational GTPase TypA [Alkalispirochaeta alkalica]